MPSNFTPLCDIFFKIGLENPRSGPFVFHVPFRYDKLTVATTVTAPTYTLLHQLKADGGDVNQNPAPTPTIHGSPLITLNQDGTTGFISGSIDVLNLDASTAAVVLRLALPLTLTVGTVESWFQIRHSIIAKNPRTGTIKPQVRHNVGAKKTSFRRHEVSGNTVKFPASLKATVEINHDPTMSREEAGPEPKDVTVEVPIDVTVPAPPASPAYLALSFVLQMIFGPPIRSGSGNPPGKQLPN